MKERVSEFPDRRTVRRDGQVEGRSPAKKSRSGRGLFLLISLAALIYWFYHSGLVPFSSDQFWYQLQHLVGLESTAELPLPSANRSQPPAAAISPKQAARVSDVPPAQAKSVVRPQAQKITFEGKKRAVPVSISLGFRPVGFKVAVTSYAIPLSSRPSSLHRRLPNFRGPSQKYGTIDLANGRRHVFVLDTHPQGYQLYVDFNRNGDLTDDGSPLPNRGKARFANAVKLPLNRVTGLPQLKGDMELWIFTTDQSWREDSLRFYNRTQLSGQLQISGKRYDAYLTDNLNVDGDYRNDGISIDINGDGKIDRRLEYLSPGGQITLNGESFRFQVVR